MHTHGACNAYSHKHSFTPVRIFCDPVPAYVSCPDMHKTMHKNKKKISMYSCACTRNIHICTPRMHK